MLPYTNNWFYGDPSIRFANFAKPDYTFLPEQTRLWAFFDHNRQGLFYF